MTLAKVMHFHESLEVEYAKGPASVAWRCYVLDDPRLHKGRAAGKGGRGSRNINCNEPVGLMRDIEVSRHNIPAGAAEGRDHFPAIELEVDDRSPAV